MQTSCQPSSTYKVRFVVDLSSKYLDVWIRGAEGGSRRIIQNASMEMDCCYIYRLIYELPTN